MEADQVTTSQKEEMPTPAVPTHATRACCEDCAERARAPEQLIYAIGHLEARFPSLGIEREYQQRLARTPRALDSAVTNGGRTRVVLEAHGHLAMSMCFVFMIGGVPAYVVAPVGSHTRFEVMDALEHAEDPDHVCVIIGRAGPISAPESCGGVVAPIVVANQIYSFTLQDWAADLYEQLGSALKSQKLTNTEFSSVARAMFKHAVNSTENLGASDAHRALNYALLQHPGLFLAAAERTGKQLLDRIEARMIHGLGSRRQVAIILTFVNLTTGVAERLFTRIDVTEPWPFVADEADGSRAPLGLAPFVESAIFGLGF